MSENTELINVHLTVRDRLLEKLGEVEDQIQAAGSAKDTVAKIADEFRTFRVLVLSILKMLRQQVSESLRSGDESEMRRRRKVIVFQGIPEVEKEDCKRVALDVINSKLGLGLSASSIKVCHRLGVHNKDHHRPILVRFTSVDTKASVWRAKTGLRGSKISMREFLTKTRQAIFAKARQHFGMRACWTQDGNIFLKSSDGRKHRVTCLEDLSPLLAKYPKAAGQSSVAQPAAGRGGEASDGNHILFICFII